MKEDKHAESSDRFELVSTEQATYISSEPQLLRKTLGIQTCVDPRVNCAGLR